MTDNIFLYAAGALILIAAGAVLLLHRRRGRTRPGRESAYIEALHRLLEGQTDEALEQLKKTVKQDSDNIMAYIKLGDIYRDRGLPAKAAKIHRNLLVRSDLNDRQVRSVLFHLVQDYRNAGALDRAVEMAERLIEKDKRSRAYQQLLLSVYEEKGDWDKAFFYRQSLNKWQKKSDMPLLALYKMQSGIAHTNLNAEREGRIRFREALKLDRTCVPAWLYWGDSYRRQNRDEDALRVWKDFSEKVPEKAYLAFSRLQQVLFDLGIYGEMEKIYKKVISRKPDTPHAHIALAELYDKQGDIEAAIRVCESVVDLFPDSVTAKHFLVELYYEKGDRTGALEMALKTISREMNRTETYSCSQCGAVSGEPLWHCPECSGWNTYLS
ncbi:tetratricopeptide repeat protein [bacterium]|nr:tetratricopeptide repeat protein [bacterium]